MCKNSTIKIAEKLIQQIDNNNDNTQAIFWLLSAINRYLLVDSKMTLSEFRTVLKEQWPDTYDAFYSSLEDKNELKKA